MLQATQDQHDLLDILAEADRQAERFLLLSPALPREWTETANLYECIGTLEELRPDGRRLREVAKAALAAAGITAFKQRDPIESAYNGVEVEVMKASYLFGVAVGMRLARGARKRPEVA